MIEVAKSVRNITLYSNISPLKKSNSPIKRHNKDSTEVSQHVKNLKIKIIYLQNHLIYKINNENI